MMAKYRVFLHTKPGVAVTVVYAGYVDVTAENDQDAIGMALDKLRRAAPRDRLRDEWVIEKVESKNGQAKSG